LIGTPRIVALNGDWQAQDREGSTRNDDFE
jgi:hypothetical protein